MYYQVVGRKEIINFRTKIIHDDEGLRALDGIAYGEKRIVKSLTEEVKKVMKKEFLFQFPNFCEEELQIERVLYA